MPKEKIQELKTLLDGLEYELKEIMEVKFRISDKVNDIRALLADNKEEF